MNPRELGKRISDVVRGREVAGTVAGVLEPKVERSQRYVVDTHQGMLDVHLMDIENKKSNLQYYKPKEPLKVGEPIHKRVRRVKPWLEGQII